MTAEPERFQDKVMDQNWEVYCKGYDEGDRHPRWVKHAESGASEMIYAAFKTAWKAGVLFGASENKS